MSPLEVFTSLQSYLHINGFIHRDIKAANLLIDDDGTVLLGDLGVAADLTEDTTSHPPSQNKTSIITATAALSQPRVLTAAVGRSSEPEAGAVAVSPTRPPIGKRKSFVGTVGFLFTGRILVPELMRIDCLAVLDGS